MLRSVIDYVLTLFPLWIEWSREGGSGEEIVRTMSVVMGTRGGSVSIDGEQ